MPPQQAPVQPPYGQQQGYAQPQGYARQQSLPQQQAGYDRAPQQQGYGQQTSNVVPFPGMQRAADGSVYAHVEYIVLAAQPATSARTSSPISRPMPLCF